MRGCLRGFSRASAKVAALHYQRSGHSKRADCWAGLHRGWRSRRVQLGALVGAVVAAAAGTWWAVSDETAAPPAPEPARELVYRRDAVRALAAETRQLRAGETRTSR